MIRFIFVLIILLSSFFLSSTLGYRDWEVEEDSDWLEEDWQDQLQLDFYEQQDSCTQYNKQPAMYGNYQFSPSLDQRPATFVENTFVWLDTSNLSRHKKGGLYAAHSISFANRDIGAGGGYFGAQLYAKAGRVGQCIFSIWDSKKVRSAKAEPQHANCKRNMNDGRAMGTQCKVKYSFQDGVKYTIRLEQYNSNSNGDYWRVSITNLSTGAQTIVGQMLFTPIRGNTSWGKIKKYSVFYEHLGCVDCNRFNGQLAQLKPMADERLAVGATGSIRKYDESSCKLNNISVCPGSQYGACGRPNLVFSSGPGVRRTVRNNQQMWTGSPPPPGGPPPGGPPPPTPPPPPPTPPPPPPGGCKNKDTNCRRYARQGHCNSAYAAWMRANCPRACKIC